MTYDDDQLLQLSGIQHFAFCRRQWALIHIEQQWRENYQTADGRIMHENAHNTGRKESRNAVKITRGMYVSSRTLGISGQCDIVEFHRTDDGIPMRGWSGKWLPFPVEYKRGRPKAGNEDELQLCAQAMCLEEMLCCPVPEGALYYGETCRRKNVEFSAELRQEVQQMLAEMHTLYTRGYTPKVKPGKGCAACSLKELCLPTMMKKSSVEEYLRKSLVDEP